MSESVNKNFELLSKDEKIEGILIEDKFTKKVITQVDRKEFSEFTNDNPYFDVNKSEQTYYSQILNSVCKKIFNSHHINILQEESCLKKS